MTGRPANPAVLPAIVNPILKQPNVSLVSPGHRHFDIMAELVRSAGCTGRMTTEVHLAAPALERKAQLASNDTDFMRFSDLDLVNPLA